MEAEKKPSDKSKKPLNPIIRYSGLGLQIAAIIGLGSWFGSWLDEQYPSDKKWYTLLFVLLSTTLAIAYTIKTLNRYNK